MKILFAICLILSVISNSFAQQLVKIPADVTYEKLEDLKLRVNRITYVLDKYQNRIIAVRYQERELQQGETIKQGSEIDLVVGTGQDDEIAVPNLIGLTLSDAQSILSPLTLQLSVNGSQKPVSNKRVITKQFPIPYSTDFRERNRVKKAGKIAVWIDQ
ncbi:hypothetical protein Q0590_36940 [Rhodocytophaga aerolata]|uniref:PASTA domain-containing protein n=1 Tax=Rhodocytophaga aerolata TaxID=455078 RepID=A0ABT8RKZ4_9BACT|nr:hypothetical protein [Rhodocytophaga aerolata]MDO1451915.1 hypothetical protein [Rhodocytophaga aerolata]